jgi:CubicO group peptidase (beta-lactamase class C family)
MLHLILPAVLLPVVVLAQGNPPAPRSQADPQKALETLLAPAAAVGEFSGSVLIRERGRDVARYSAGAAIREFAVPFTPNTRSMIGSIAKQFTAAAIAVLADRGVLSLDDKLARWLPAFPRADQITIRQMLSHTAGLSRDLPGGPHALRIPRTPREMVDLIATDTVHFAPGTRSAYSNNGYRILGFLIDSLSGTSYADFVRSELLEPAGMPNTGSLAPLTTVERLARGYVPGFGAQGFGPALYADISNGVGPGSLYSTVDDLARWGEVVIRDGHALPAVRRTLLSDGGLGVAIDTVAGREVIWHNGVYQGYTALLAVFPADSITIVYLSNTETLLSESPLQAALYQLALGGTVTALQVEPLGTAPLPRDGEWYVGKYNFFPGLDVMITTKGDALLLDGMPLEHQGGGTFYFRLKGSKIRFDDGGNQSPGMQWTDPGGTYPARRVTP